MRQVIIPAVAALCVGLLLLPACTGMAPVVTGRERSLEQNCKANYTTYDWQRIQPPAESVRTLYSSTVRVPQSLWFKGQAGAIAACVPCDADSALVRSFEWYEPGYRKGELRLKRCEAAGR